ncbi:MAG: phenylalanine--tRNA ligase subunit beta [Acidimicrobiales bacterium]
MRATLSWLRELTPLAADPRDRGSVAELASELDALGLVVEKAEWVGQGIDDVVLARVLEIAAIKGADRIRRVVVDRGNGETVEVVCGAWNFEVGDVVVLAPVGSELPGGLKIERRKLRGTVSNGMLCSGRELGLSDDHDGILVLARMPAAFLGGAELGSPLSSHLGFGPDVVFDLAIEPNRPDCLSMVGIARDLAARYGLPLRIPEPSLTESSPPATELATVAIDAPEICQRLIARVLTRVRPVASPALIQRRLLLAGMRPIGHIVDASNYVMFELGQPTHPYDLDQLGGGGLRVRAAHPGETIVTLDGETRILGGRPSSSRDQLAALDGLICNANDLPVGIAGIMGGRSSEISDATERILLEVASFSAVSIGRTARHVGTRTEASLRFERGVDPEGMERAAARVCELVVDAALAAGIDPPLVAGGIIDVNPRPFERAHVILRAARANDVLGISLGAREMTELLSPIGYEADLDSASDHIRDEIELLVPSWRPDVAREIDVVEDVARTYGYRRIPRSERRSPYVGKLDEVQTLRRRLRRVLTGLGAHEAWTSSIVDPLDQELAGANVPFLKLSNPMVTEESALRPGLLAGLLKALRHNAGHRNPWVRLFEIGEVFALDAVVSDSGTEVRHVPTERERLAVLFAREGDGAPAAVEAWRVLADSLGIDGVQLCQPLIEMAASSMAPDGTKDSGAESGADRDEASLGPRFVFGSDVRGPAPGPTPPPALELTLAGLHVARSGLLVAGQGSSPTVLGAVGEVDPEILSAFGVPHLAVGWLELDIDRLGRAPRQPDLALPVSRYPSSDLDLAFSVAESVPAARVEETLRLAAGELCESVELFDVYRGAGLEAGSRSLAYRLRLGAADRTLTDEDLAAVRTLCIDAVESSFPASLRS